MIELLNLGDDWKQVEDFPVYWVSKRGDIISTKFDGIRLLKGKKEKTGHISIHISKDGKVYNKYLHVLILETFTTRRPEGMFCCHNNGISNDNRLENLRWDTPKANVMDRMKHGRGARGETSNSKLSEKQVIEVKKRIEKGEKAISISKDYGNNKSIIQDILRGRTWAWLTI